MEWMLLWKWFANHWSVSEHWIFLQLGVDRKIGYPLFPFFEIFWETQFLACCFLSLFFINIDIYLQLLTNALFTSTIFPIILFPSFSCFNIVHFLLLFLWILLPLIDSCSGTSEVKVFCPTHKPILLSLVIGFKARKIWTGYVLIKITHSLNLFIVAFI